MRRVVHGRTRNKNTDFTPNERAFYIHRSIAGVQSIINKCMKNYDKTGDLNALKVAFDGYVSLAEMLRHVEELYSYGHDFEDMISKVLTLLFAHLCFEYSSRVNNW
jgi:hypothetical protein